MAEGGLASKATLSQPEGLARDGAGNIYFADADDHRVRRINTDGTIDTVAGTGMPGYSGDGNGAVQAQLSSPYGLAFDHDGNLYIADLGNARVRRVAGDGTITTFAGGGSSEPQADGTAVLATEARLTAPRNVAADASGNIYISDFGAHRVYRVDANGFLHVFAGKGKKGFAGDAGPANAALFSSPAGLAIDRNGVLYIADSGNKRIRRVIAGRVWGLGFANDPGGLGELANMPTGLSFNAAGNLYIANRDGAPIVMVSTGGVLLATGATGQDVLAGDDGSLLVSKASTIRKVSLDGKSDSVIAGGPDFHFGGDNGPAEAARLYGPYALAATAEQIFLADMQNHRVRSIDAGGVIHTAAGDGNAQHLNEPAGLAISGDGRLYIADRGNHVILNVSWDGRLVAIAGTGTAGFNGNTLAQTSELNAPHAITFDSDGNLYVADTGNGRIRKITPAGYISSVAGGGAAVTDEPIPALAAKLAEPRGLAFDADGYLWVADTAAGRVRRISPSGIMTSPFTMHFDAPRSISFTPDGTMILVESDGNRVAAITPDGQYTPIAGAGERGFSGDGGSALDALLSAPMDAVALPDGSVLIADFGNNRVRKLVRPVAAEVTAAVLRIVHGATGREGPLAPGQIAKVSGLDFTPDDEIRFGEERAMVLAQGAAEVTVVVPEALRGFETAPVVVLRNGEVVGLGTAELTANAPGVFNVLNGDGTTNSPENPAPRGSVVTLRATGIEPEGDALHVWLGGYSADVLSVNGSLDEPGIVLIKARVPSGFVPAGDLPLVLRVGDAKSPSGCTISLN